jgi:hypothetical protein
LSIFISCSFASVDAEWFDPTNADALDQRAHCNAAAVRDMTAFLRAAPNAIAVLDCTNHTHARRLALVNAIRPTGACVRVPSSSSCPSCLPALTRVRPVSV